MPRKKTFDLPEEARAIFSAASARRQRHSTACEVCGAPLENVILKRRYCSGRCATRAYRERQRAQAATDTPQPAPTAAAPPRFVYCRRCNGYHAPGETAVCDRRRGTL